MSANILLNYKQAQMTHFASDDIESLVYVLIWMCMLYVGPGTLHEDKHVSTQSQDYPYAKNEYKLVIAIYRTRMTILMQEMNAIADSHLLHENCQEAERIQ